MNLQTKYDQIRNFIVLHLNMVWFAQGTEMFLQFIHPVFKLKARVSITQSDL